MSQATMTWGDQLVVAVHRAPCGVNPAVNAIRGVIGSHIGVRNTFAKLLSVDSVESLNHKDRFRAWLLITTLDADPEDFGLTEDDVPPVYDIDRVRKYLRAWRDSNPQPSVLESPTPDNVVRFGVPTYQRHATTTPIPDRRIHAIRFAA